MPGRLLFSLALLAVLAARPASAAGPVPVPEQLPRYDLALTLDYGEIYQVVREQVESTGRDTIEAVAEHVAGALLQSYARLESVLVRVKKPNAPIPGAQLAWVAVEIVRRQDVLDNG